MRQPEESAVIRVAAAFFVFIAAGAACARAQSAAPSASPAPTPAASPAPSASPQPTPGFSVHGSGANVFLDQATGGAGQLPPEGPAFAQGNPNAPMSPYDWFSTAPETPGVAGEVQYLFNAAYRWTKITAGADFMASGIGGDVTNAIYWGEPLLGPLDPHEGRSIVPYGIVFPTHAGQFDATGGQVVAPYDASLRANDGSWSVTGGFVAPAGYDAFVFTPPAFTTVVPSMNEQTYEAVGPAIADVDSWNHQATALPLLGVDATATIGGVGVEATDALLPAPSGSGARLWGAAATFDRGDAGRFSLDFIHVGTFGAPQLVPTLYGANPQLHYGAQGALATSTVSGERQTIAGGRAFFHPWRKADVLVELARAWFDAALVARPGTSLPGNYQHYAVSQNFGGSFDLGAEFYRFDPRYATAVLPYGIPENVWGIAWAYPGPWLKGTYQLVNDQIAGANRVGPRFHADWHPGKLELHAAYYAYRQVEASLYGNLTQTGFVEVDYLSERPGDDTLGQTHGAIAYAGWHAGADTFGVDFARDEQYRGYNGNAIGDYVDTRYDQLVLSERHQFSSKLIGVAGYGRYSVDGTWSTTPIYGINGLGFVGGEWAFAPNQQLFVQVRRYGLNGLPSIPGGPLPTLRGTALIVDHHITF